MKEKNPNPKIRGRLSSFWSRISLCRKTIIIVLALTFLGAMAILLFGNTMLPASRTMKVSDYQEGMVADKDIIVEQGITYIDEEATRLKQEAELKMIPPVFIVHDDITRQIMQEYAVFRSLMSEDVGETPDKDMLFLELQSKLPAVFAREDMDIILPCSGNEPLLEHMGNLLERIMVDGVAALPEDMEKETVEIVRWRDGVKEREEKKLSQVTTSENLPATAEELAPDAGIAEDNIPCARFIVSTFARENAFYDAELTDAAQQQALAAVDPVTKKLLPGEMILKKGFVITPEHMEKLRVLGNYSSAVNLNGVIGTTLYLLIILALGVVLYIPPLTKKAPSQGMISFLAATCLLYLLLNVLILKLRFFPDYIPYTVLMPTALAAMLISILHTPRGGIISAILLSLSVLIFYRDTPFPFLFAFLSGTSGTFAVMGAEKRITLVRASLVLSALNVCILVTLGLLQNYTIVMHLRAAVAGISNGILCGVMNIGLLPFFEHILNVPTPFRLMELSNLNTPLFKRMLILAPGTYSHSISVANLAESACREIGANGLLARVGAYYHDIGKIDQAEYFIENQTAGNKHDELKPNLSTAVIKAHVKSGIEKGKDLGLPKAVVDIIAQHHGNGLISYFYMQAMKDRETNKMSPEDFSYNGTPPLSKEAAVVMLADAVEAASRLMKKPTMAKLEKFVWNTIMEKVTEKQMRNTDLTFKDMEIISRTFVQILAGHFHSRIEYPGTNGNKP